MVKIEDIEIGTEVHIVDNGKIMTGKVTGYQADFHAPWNEFIKNYDKVSWLYGVNNKLLGVWINVPSVTRVDGNEYLYSVDKIFKNIHEAEKQVELVKQIHNKNIEEKIEELKSKIVE